MSRSSAVPAPTPIPDAPRPRAAHLGPEARRPLVLDAALRAWNARGRAGVTMAAIAAEAQVSKPVLYECFANKEAVLAALLDREEEVLLRSALEAVPTSLSSPLRDVAAAYRSFFEAVVDHPLSWRVVFDARRTGATDVPGVVGRRYRTGRAQVVRQVATLLDLTGLAPAFRGEAELLVAAEHVVGLAEVNGWLLLQEGTTWRPDTLADVVARLLLGGLLGQVDRTDAG